MTKNKDFLENLLEYHFLNIIVNVNFFSELKFEYYCEYFSEILLQVSVKKEIKIDGRGHEMFSEKFRSMVSWATKLFL